MVTVVGCGLSGIACAVALREARVPVRLIERGQEAGGRMASPLVYGRRVDVGAAYFTVRDPQFKAVVDRWARRGLARPWTDTFDVLAPATSPETSSGPMRWAAPGGLRALVRDLATGLDVEFGDELQDLRDQTRVDIALAMPDSQSRRLVRVPAPVADEPVIAVACGFLRREWSIKDAAFVNGHPDVAFIADDGSRRGDGALVLVVHSTAELANRCLDEPEDAVPALVAGLRELLGIGEPDWTYTHPWSFARPAGRHRATHGFALLEDGRRVGLAGDQWCREGVPRVESAWRSGTDLGRAMADWA